MFSARDCRLEPLGIRFLHTQQHSARRCDCSETSARAVDWRGTACTWAANTTGGLRLMVRRQCVALFVAPRRWCAIKHDKQTQMLFFSTQLFTHFTCDIGLVLTHASSAASRAQFHAACSLLPISSSVQRGRRRWAASTPLLVECRPLPKAAGARGTTCRCC